MSDSPWFVYLLVCRNGHIYTGVTPHLERRLTAHRLGKGAKYTRSNPPERVLAINRCKDKSTAMRLEIQVKRMRRETKILLAKAWVAEHPIDELLDRLFA